MLTWACPLCGEELSAEDEFLDNSFQCPGCQGKSTAIAQIISDVTDDSSSVRSQAEETPIGLSPTSSPQKVFVSCRGCQVVSHGFLIPDGRFICPNCHPEAVLNRWTREWEPIAKNQLNAERKRQKQNEADARQLKKEFEEVAKGEARRRDAEEAIRRSAEEREARLHQVESQRQHDTSSHNIPKSVKNKRLRWIGASIGTVLLLAVGVWTYNHFCLQTAMNKVLSQDERNSRIGVSVHFENYLDTSTLVYDLREFHDKTRADIFRVFLQFSAEMKDREFKRVILANSGTSKFVLEGAYFRELGVEYGQQNPVYTIRTFPSHLYDSNGKGAYGTWEGGLLGVVKNQMDDFNDFISRWTGEKNSP